METLAFLYVTPAEEIEIRLAAQTFRRVLGRPQWVLQRSRSASVLLLAGVLSLYLNSLPLQSMAASSPIKMGMRGPEVVLVQAKLQRAGFLDRDPNGEFDKTTDSALRAFQEKQNLVQDGIAGGDTLDRLNALVPSTRLVSKTEVTNVTELIDPQANQPVRAISMTSAATEPLVASRLGGTTTGDVALAAASKDKTATLTKDDQISKATGDVLVLKQGSEGQDVRSLQRLLKVRGFFSEAVTGYFGAKTETAVRQFQASQKLKVDGVVGETTWQKLRSTTQPSSTQNQPERPQTKPRTVNAQVLKLGSEGEDVRSLQQRLKERGFFSEAVTGYFGAKTETAVRQFQASQKLKVDGVVGETTWQKLRSTTTNATDVSHRAAAPTRSIVTSGSPPARLPLTPGTRDDRVSQVQKRLGDLGLFKGDATGFYGSVTEAAVRRYQGEKNLKEDGVVGETTWAALFSTPTPKPETQADRPTKTAPSTQTVAAKSQSKALGKGSSGAEVTKIQDRLRALGFLKVPSTAWYGDVTVQAVKDFQRQQDLEVTGQVDSATWSRLFYGNAENNQVQKVSDKPVSTITPGDKVSLSEGMSDGNNDRRIYNLQTQLIKLHYLKIDKPTGYYGSMTAKAVMAFQKDKGLSATGVVNQATWNRLMPDLDTVYDPPTSADGDTVPVVVPKPSQFPLREGMKDLGEKGSIYQLQAQLMNLQYLNIDQPTSYYGPMTTKAITAFQRDKDLKVSGMVDEATWDRLMPSPPKAAPPKTAFQTLKIGDRGDGVKQLQGNLQTLGFYKGPLDGVYGLTTERAVRNFQASYKIRPDGIWGTSSQAVLDAELERKSVNGVTRATPSAVQVGVETSDTRVEQQNGVYRVSSNPVFTPPASASPRTTSGSSTEIRSNNRLGRSYVVLVPTATGQNLTDSLLAIRKLYPDAYVNSFNEGKAIQTGTFPTFNQARAQESQLRAAGFVDARVVVKH